ncbi:SAG family member [Eimeria brunetti]|uniref:SAG family member n=1 Tax=Eimeria brunetti TaxID=51314 RepID=U6L8Z8_9EIME|nr:SAG family member [Eimeria brunetti]
MLFQNATVGIIELVVSLSVVFTGSKAVCLDEVNDARGAAGFANFTTASEEVLKWPQTSESTALQSGDPWLPVCEALVPKDEASTETRGGSTAAFVSGTYAFMALNSDQPECSAAVDHWKEAFSNFTSIPPSKTDGGNLYDKRQNISFVAMYNPIDGAAADCRVVTCTLKASAAGRTLRSDAEGKKGYALLCMTVPDAFKDGKTSPFTEDEWSKIKKALTGSASAVGPSLLAIAAVALGLVAL